MEQGVGDILKTDVEAVVNTVNCVGVMGRGIALQFKNRYPGNFRAYKAACDRGEVRPGRMFVYDVGAAKTPRYIINFPTKRHWREGSRMEDIASGLAALREELVARSIRSVAVPPLGCGLGGLDWEQVRPMIVEALDGLRDVRVVLYEPGPAPPASQMARAAKAPAMTPGRAALVELLRRYLQAVMDPSVTLLEVHKLMYFMQAAGEPLRLNYVKAAYGPYATNLGQVLKHVEGHLITGYGDGEDDPAKPLALLPNAAEQAEAYLATRQEALARFDRVARLTEGFESSYGMELLATVHWVARQEGAANPEQAVDLTHRWNSRKAMFPDQHLHKAWQVLQSQGWL
ncbi:MAG: macro domain-containing protein [bacterium]